MAEVGSAFVSILPSAKGFGSKLSKQVEPETKKTGTSLGRSLGKAFAIAGGAAAAVGFVKGAIGEAREAQKVGALTAAVIKSTGGAANVTAKEVGNLANAISRKTGIDDETIQSGENMLLTFKNIRNEAGKGNDVFNQSTKTLVDMAAALGKDPKQAAIQLGKALNDPIKGMTALGRAGVQFTDGQKKTVEQMVKTGNIMGAQKLILRELNSEFGGAAAAQATAGDKARVAFENMQETIGTALLPTLDRLSNFFTGKVAPAVTKFVGQMQSGKGAGGEFAATLDSVGDAGQAALKALQPLVTLAGNAAGAFGKLPGPIKTLAIEAGIAALVFPRLARGIGSLPAAFTNPIATSRNFAASLQNVETRAAAVNRVVSGIKTGAGVAGMTLLADGARRSGGALKELETIGGAALMGFAVGGPIGAAVFGGGTALIRLGIAGSNAGKKIEGAKAGVGSIIGTLNQVTGAATQATRSLTFNTIAKQGGFEAFNKIKSAYSGLAITERDLVQASMGNVGAQRRVTAALNTATASVKKSAAGDSSKYKSVQDVMKATQAVNKVIGVNSAQNKKATATERAHFRATASTSQLLKRGMAPAATTAASAVGNLGRRSQRASKDVHGVGSEIKKVPNKTKVDLNVDTHGSEDKVRTLREQMQALQDRTLHIRTITDKPHAPAPGENALGTNDWRGGPTWVGERGPEIVDLPRHARVIPNDKISAGGGAAVFHLYDSSGVLMGTMRGMADSRVAAGSGIRNEAVRARR